MLSRAPLRRSKTYWNLGLRTELGRRSRCARSSTTSWLRRRASTGSPSARSPRICWGTSSESWSKAHRPTTTTPEACAIGRFSSAREDRRFKRHGLYRRLPGTNCARGWRTGLRGSTIHRAISPRWYSPLWRTTSSRRFTPSRTETAESGVSSSPCSSCSDPCCVSRFSSCPRGSRLAASNIKTGCSTSAGRAIGIAGCSSSREALKHPPTTRVTESMLCSSGKSRL